MYKHLRGKLATVCLSVTADVLCPREVHFRMYFVAPQCKSTCIYKMYVYIQRTYTFTLRSRRITYTSTLILRECRSSLARW